MAETVEPNNGLVHLHKILRLEHFYKTKEFLQYSNCRHNLLEQRLAFPPNHLHFHCKQEGLVQVSHNNDFLPMFYILGNGYYLQ